MKTAIPTAIDASADRGMESAVTLTAAQEWRRHWPLVLASFVGLSLPVVPFYAVGLFMQPLTQEFGWSRTLIAAGGSLAAAFIVPLSPFIGALIDRWGVRRLALPGLFLTGLAIASFGLATSPTDWLLYWGFYAVAAALLKATIWTSAISHAFTASRSLALAVVLAGAGLAATLAPPLARWLIDAYGWRHAFMFLGLCWGGPAFLLGLFFLRDVRDGKDMAPSRSSAAKANLGAPGLSIGEALRSPPLIKIAIATFLTLLFSSTLVIHKVPILMEAGVSREHAAFLASFSGLAGVVGGLLTGWMTDRWDAGTIGSVTNAMMAVSLLLLLEPFRSPAMIMLSMLVAGYAGGSKLQLCSYLTGVYAGLRNYGKIFGVMASIIAFTGAVGPLFGGWMYDMSGNYNGLIMTAIGASAMASVLLLRLGPVPDWAPQARPQLAEEAA